MNSTLERFDAPSLRRAFTEAVATMFAAVAALLCTLAIQPETGPCVLAVVLCLSLSRSQLDRDRHGWMEAVVALPLVAVVAGGVGLLLRHFPLLGALAFTVGISLSIWLRQFGPDARRAGSLIALPFVALLTTPYRPPVHPGVLPPALIPVLIALLALFWVTIVHALARRTGLLPPAAIAAAAPKPPPVDPSRLSTSTRMAIQMGVALALSFVVGYAFFPGHWSWIVLTAFIVNSGNRGRLDVAWKSLHRLLGAAAGSVIALTFGVHAGTYDAAIIALMLTALFVGVWLRPFGYAWWALCVTVAMALLQGFDDAPVANLLWMRLGEIALGAAIGVASAWFVLPVRSTGVLRRRLADALAALSTAFDPGAAVRRMDSTDAALAAVAQIAPAFRVSSRLTRDRRSLQACRWIDALAACKVPAATLIERGMTPPDVRRAIGAARKALREPQELEAALENLRLVLDQACETGMSNQRREPGRTGQLATPDPDFGAEQR